MGVDGNSDWTKEPEGCTSLRPLNLQIDAQQRALGREEALMANPDRSWSSGLVYVGAMQELYERDGVVVPGCLEDRRFAQAYSGIKAGVEVLVYNDWDADVRRTTFSIRIKPLTCLLAT